jgi:hypothetical protein
MAPLIASSVYWHLPLLIVLISLVYSGTRYDDWPHIWREALRWGLRLTGFIAIVILVMAVVAATI